MGDSEDEYDRKRRDKFRGERAEGNYRGTERSVRPRDEWSERYVLLLIYKAGLQQNRPEEVA